MPVLNPGSLITEKVISDSPFRAQKYTLIITQKYAKIKAKNYVKNRTDFETFRNAANVIESRCE